MTHRRSFHRSVHVIVSFFVVVRGLLLVEDKGRRGTTRTSSLPNKIWMFWEGPEPPQLNKLCMKMWRDINPGWELTVIDDKLIMETFPELAKTFKEVPRTISHKADMVRLQWLATFGGVWADASVLPLMPLDAFVQQLAAPSGFFAFHSESYCKRFPAVASWFLVAEPKNQLVVAWRDELLKRWKGEVPTSERAKTDPLVEDSGAPWAYYEIGYTLESLIKESKPVRTVFNHMPNVSADWPEQCNWGEEESDKGCPAFWTLSSSDNRPPMLKRPSVIKDDGWLQSYHRMVATMNGTRKVTSTWPTTWDRTNWNEKYAAHEEYAKASILPQSPLIGARQRANAQ